MKLDLSLQHIVDLEVLIGMQLDKENKSIEYYERLYVQEYEELFYGENNFRSQQFLMGQLDFYVNQKEYAQKNVNTLDGLLSAITKQVRDQLVENNKTETI